MTAAALAQGNGRRAAALVTAAIGRGGRPTRTVRRAPAPGEAIADPRGERRAGSSTSGPSVSTASSSATDSSRTAAAARGGAGGDLRRAPDAEARPFTAEALEERGGGQRGQLAQGADAPSASSRAAISGGRSSSASGAGARYAASPSGSTTGDALVQAAGEARADAAARDAHADSLPARARRRHETPGELLLAAKEPAEPGGVEIDVIGAAFLHPGRVGERHLEQRARRRGGIAAGSWTQETGDAAHSRHSIAQAARARPPERRAEESEASRMTGAPARRVGAARPSSAPAADAARPRGRRRYRSAMRALRMTRMASSPSTARCSRGRAGRGRGHG